MSLADRWNWPFHRANSVGWVIPPGRIVLDLDPAPGCTTEDLQDVVRATYGQPIPLDLVQRTRRGMHALFSIDRPVVRGKLDLPTSKAGQVDIKGPLTSYVALYDDHWAQMHHQALPVPHAFHIAATVQRRTVTRPRNNSTRLSGTSDRWAGFTAVEGQRNADLNREVFLACLAFELDEISLGEIWDLASKSGLSDAEIESTISSAVDGALRASARSREWLEVVKSAAHGRYSAAEGAYRIARRLAFFAQYGDPQSWVAMSYREMAELLAVRSSTAHGYVATLQDLRLLVHVGVDHYGRAEFALTYPDGTLAFDVANPNTHPAPPSTGKGVSWQNSDGLIVGHEWFASHRAFHRGPGALPAGSKPLLWVLRSGPQGRRELGQTTRCERTSLWRYLDVLQAVGMIHERDGLISLTGELGQLLDTFARDRHLSDRRLALKQVHAAERASFAASQAREVIDWMDEPWQPAVRRTEVSSQGVTG